jgi:hypothetical protein
MALAGQLFTVSDQEKLRSLKTHLGLFTFRGVVVMKWEVLKSVWSPHHTVTKPETQAANLGARNACQLVVTQFPPMRAELNCNFRERP